MIVKMEISERGENRMFRWYGDGQQWHNDDQAHKLKQIHSMANKHK